MNRITDYFELPSDEFISTLYRTNAFISGGSTLNAFFNTEIKDNQDLDIFVRIPYTKENNYKDLDNYCPFEELVVDRFETFFKSIGYKRLHGVGTFSQSMTNQNTNEIEYHRCALSHFVKCIKTYTKDGTKDGKKIQLIFLYKCSIEEFMDTFDLNICRLAITADYNDKGKLKLQFYHEQSKYLSDTELDLIWKKIMYVMNPLYPSNLSKRIHKYVQRGYTWVEPTTLKSIKSTSLNDINNYVKNNLSNQIIDYENFLLLRKQKLENKYSNCNASV